MRFSRWNTSFFVTTSGTKFKSSTIVRSNLSFSRTHFSHQIALLSVSKKTKRRESHKVCRSNFPIESRNQRSLKLPLNRTGISRRGVKQTRTGTEQIDHFATFLATFVGNERGRPRWSGVAHLPRLNSRDTRYNTRVHNFDGISTRKHARRTESRQRLENEARRPKNRIDILAHTLVSVFACERGFAIDYARQELA